MPKNSSPSTGLSVSRLGDLIVEACFRPRPLQDETSTFILVNVLDIFVTHMLLSIGGSEANPVARYFLDRWGFDGMIFFKMSIITIFCVVTLLIAGQHLERAKSLMRFGTIVVACVVIYGSCLMIISQTQNVLDVLVAAEELLGTSGLY